MHNFFFVCAEFLSKAPKWKYRKENGNNTGFEIRQTWCKP